jgi:hypothetical protein
MFSAGRAVTRVGNEPDVPAEQAAIALATSAAARNRTDEVTCVTLV